MPLRNAIATLALTGCLLAQSGPATAIDDPNSVLTELQHKWARANYQVPEQEREQALRSLADEARKAANAFPQSAELLAWRGIILSTYAGAKGGLGAVDLAKEALQSLQDAARIDESAIGGGIYTSMGVLYYKVPGWPLGFGDDDKAAELLAKGLALNPTGIDENYFYADFLIDQGEEKEALTYLDKALHAAARPGREDADAGRKKDIEADLAKIAD